MTNNYIMNEDHNEVNNKRQKFSKEEDQLLIKLVKELGNSQWNEISTHFIDKNARQCRVRFKKYLDPSINNNRWTTEEDSLLLDLVEKNGKKWSKLIFHFKNRTDINIKHRFKLLERKKIKNNTFNNIQKEKKNIIPSIIDNFPFPIETNLNIFFQFVH